MLRLCNECLNGKLSFKDLNAIAFAIFCSEHLSMDENDEMVNDVLFGWDNPEIEFPLTIENMKKWKLFLETGVNTFDYKELKQKKKNSKYFQAETLPTISLPLLGTYFSFLLNADYLSRQGFYFSCRSKDQSGVSFKQRTVWLGIGSICTRLCLVRNPLRYCR